MARSNAADAVNEIGARHLRRRGVDERPGAAAGARAAGRDEIPNGLLPVGATRWDGPPLDAWNAWTPRQVHERLAGLSAPWCVIGGWSIDLAAGLLTRPHEDLEIGVLRSNFDEVRRVLHSFAVFVVGDGEVRRLVDGEQPPTDRHQNWVLDVDADEWRMDVMLESGSTDEWVYRRDERLAAPRSAMVAASADGIPYLRPHGTLLYKAKDTRPKDHADFDVAAPLLSPEERSWLAAALATLYPEHPWIDRLESIQRT